MQKRPEFQPHNERSKPAPDRTSHVSDDNTEISAPETLVIHPLVHRRQLISRVAWQNQVLQIQKTHGNAAVRRMIATGALTRPKVQRDDTDGGPPATDGGPPAPDTTGSGQPPVDDTLVKDLQQGDETMTGERIAITDELLSTIDTGRRSEPDLGDHNKNADKSKFTYQQSTNLLYGKDGTGNPQLKDSDVRQGLLGDCYLLSAMKAIARVNPEALRKLIVPKDDGTYDVTLYVYAHFWSSKRSPKVVKVKPTFPTKAGGQTAYANGPVLWPLLIEKAYAQEKGGYDDIEGGFGNEAMELLTNQKSSKIDPGDLSDDDLAKKVDELIKAKNAITAGSKHLFWKSDKKKADDLSIVTGHEYSVLAVDVGAKTIDLDNPWGYKNLKGLAISDFKKYYNELSWNPAK